MDDEDMNTSLSTDDFKVRSLLRDPDALVLYALVAAYLVMPAVWLGQVVDRLDDPLPITLLAAAGAGRFGVRIGGVMGFGKTAAAVAPEIVHTDRVWPHDAPTSTGADVGRILPPGEGGAAWAYVPIGGLLTAVTATGVALLLTGGVS